MFPTRAMLPKPDVLNDYEFGKFVLSNLAAKRAKQIREGAPPLVQIESSNPLTIALEEIAQGRIKPLFNSSNEALVERVETPLLLDESRPAEFGLLLPALDETEVALVTTLEEDTEAEAVEEDVLSLNDLMDDDAEPVTVATEDDTLSLSDIEDQESAQDDEGDREEA